MTSKTKCFCSHLESLLTVIADSKKVLEILRVCRLKLYLACGQMLSKNCFGYIVVLDGNMFSFPFHPLKPSWRRRIALA